MEIVLFEALVNMMARFPVLWNAQHTDGSLKAVFTALFDTFKIMLWFSNSLNCSCFTCCARCCYVVCWLKESCQCVIRNWRYRWFEHFVIIIYINLTPELVSIVYFAFPLTVSIVDNNFNNNNTNPTHVHIFSFSFPLLYNYCRYSA